MLTLRQEQLQKLGNAWDVLESLTGIIEAPTDWSAGHDHDLYHRIVDVPKENHHDGC